MTSRSCARAWLKTLILAAAVCNGPLLDRATSAADTPATVAGRTAAEWVGELNSSNAVAQRRAVLSLGAFGPSAVPALIQALSHRDPAVRYWAASELGDLGNAAVTARDALRILHKDVSLGMRLPAAYALCRIGHVEEGLPTLLEGLKHRERGVWNSAGDFLARVGPLAKPAIPDIELAAKRSDNHITDICNEALRRIRGIDAPLPTPTSAPITADAVADNNINTKAAKKSATATVFSKAFSDTKPLAAGASTGRQFNVLWISAEDISPSLGCYGDQYAVTPRLDQLASEGVRFTNCFTHTGVCAVSRSGLITGMYPIAIGSQHMRSNIVPPPFVKCFPEYLRAAGYWCTNRSKTDYNFNAPPSAWDENSPQSRDWRGRAPGQPFFSVINLTTTHESQIRARFATTQHDPAKAELPPYIPDMPATRRDWARYADLLTTLDRQVAAILDQLEADGLAKDTVVFFWGDHGQGLSRGKRWLYDSGVRTPLIVRWPNHIPRGSVCDDMTCFLDFAPTMLLLADVKIPDDFQGQVLPPLEAGVRGQGSGLRNQNRDVKNPLPRPQPSVLSAHPREYVFGHRDRMDETYDLIRSARDKRFKYLRNFAPRRTYAQNIAYMNEMPTMKEMRRLNAAEQLTGAAALYFRETKPVEELFDTHADPHEVVNLADKPEHAETLQRMRAALERWQDAVGDLGLTPEPLLAAQMRPNNFQVAKTAAPEITVKTTRDTGRATYSLRCSTDGASLIYATGADGAASWRVYVSPLELPVGTMVRAQACRLGFQDSEEVRSDMPK